MLVVGSASARNGHWEPPGIAPASESLATVLALYAKTSGGANPAYAQRVEHYALVAGGERVTSERIVRGADFKAVTTIDGGAFASGRDAGIRWRRTPNGVTRTISIDVQGDDLDRWPLADLPFAPQDCTLAGEAEVPKPAWVVEYHPAHDVPHWFYIDKASGALVRETWRDGSVVVSLDFSDIREVDGTRRAYHWVASGTGQTEEVTLLSVQALPVSQSDVARPPSKVTMFDAVPPGETKVAAAFRYGGVAVVTTGTLEGRATDFILDSGTTQILIDGGLAHRYGIHTFLGHGIVTELSLGNIHLHGVAIQTTDLGRFTAQAIIGYDLFANRVVHVDYPNGQVSVLDKVPDPVAEHAFHLDTDCSAGMPVVRATVGTVSGTNFALDTGSAQVVLLRYFWERDGANANELSVQHAKPYAMNYLEGPVVVDDIKGDVLLGHVKVTDESIAVERTNAGNTIEAPLDGIIGANVLAVFEWWFDCANHSIWFRYNSAPKSTT